MGLFHRKCPHISGRGERINHQHTGKMDYFSDNWYFFLNNLPTEFGIIWRQKIYISLDCIFFLALLHLIFCRIRPFYMLCIQSIWVPRRCNPCYPLSNNVTHPVTPSVKLFPAIVSRCVVLSALPKYWNISPDDRPP